ncbi:hypothetical protein M9979_09945 [Sphingomonas sp. RP10(2022)]|uniref:Uncharacterized protein n=1 Tax=Sphingomonas liriopis TaxID=2949094 RepID=A0A9X2KQP1_9SPHN|nr:hypothetical protein [Sphingomonas liriopis]MCP3735190.1 hypothetical protein [Sphingomonas liriopis]
MELLSLPDARLSLEFTEDEMPMVVSGLRLVARRFRKPMQVTSKQATTHRVLHVGGARFILMTEDGDPALLSTSAHGDAMLRAVVDTVRSVRTREKVRGASHAAPLREHAC